MAYKLGLHDKFYYFEYLLGVLYSNDNFIVMPVIYMWFIPTLFLTEIAFYILRKYVKNDYKLLLTILLLGVIGYINSILPYKFYGIWHIETVFISIVFYYVGYIFKKYIFKFKNFFDSKIKSSITGLLLTVVGIFAMYNNNYISMNTNKYGSLILFTLSSFSTIFAIVIFTRLVLKKDYVFKIIGKNSLFFLTYQIFIIHLIRHFFPTSSTNNLYVFLTSIVTTIVLFPCSIIAKKYVPIFYGKIKKDD